MYSPLNMTLPQKKSEPNMSLDPFTEGGISFIDQANQFYTEAVFSDGKSTVAPILKAVQAVKDELDKQTGDQEKSAKEVGDWHRTPAGEARGPMPKRRNFDPKAFWKHKVWKDLEDAICDVFGFRTAQIMPYIERYNSKEKVFESRELNAFVYNRSRYPIEALVTDKGLYDKSRSLILDMRISLGLIKALTPDEIVAVMLHEIGHGIDPALVDIKFLEVNVLSKYITDRKNKINKDEQKAIKQNKLTEAGLFFIAWLGIVILMVGSALIEPIKRLFMGKEKYNKKQQEKRLKRIKEALSSDRRQFNRQVYSEAFADNFARMYGYGAQLMSGIKKLSSSFDKELKSRYKKESVRQEIITRITISALQDVHKTDIHRVRSLLREYENDLADPNIPEEVKKQIREDKEELEKVLDQYLNSFDAFQNRVNKMLNEELEKLDKEIDAKKGSSERKQDPSKVAGDSDKKTDTNGEKEKEIKESVTFFESKEAAKKLQEAKKSLTPEERATVNKLFGKTACSFAKDKDGYYCYTHRCRSKSYPSIDKIPQDRVDFVNSTS